MSEITAVVFDWAGTTVDFGCCAPAGVFQAVFGNHGIDVTMLEARGPMGMHKRDHVAAVLALPRITAQWRKAHGADPSDDVVERLYQEAIPLQIECLPRYSDLIDGTLETCDVLRAKGIKIGSTTGYVREMLDVVQREAASRGYRPDVAIPASAVPQGRPSPFMCWEALKQLGCWPANRAVKVGDTVPDVAEGLNAGMWVVGIAQTGNEVGLNVQEFAALPFVERRQRTARARRTLSQAGAHFVIDSIAELPALLPRLESLMARGNRP